MEFKWNKRHSNCLKVGSDPATVYRSKTSIKMRMLSGVSVCSGRLPLKLNPAFQEDPPSNRKSSSWSSVFFLGSLLSTATEDNTSEQSWTNTYFPSFLSYTYRKVNPSAYTCIFFSILNCYCTGQQPATGGEEFINTVHQQCGLWLVI